MQHRAFFWLGLFSFLVVFCACNDFKAWYAKEFKQDELSSGIARLSTQHLTMVTNELGKRFKDPNVATEIIPANDPQEHGKGTLIRTIENFDIDYPNEQVVYRDCVGMKASWQGGMHVVKATQSIYGRLTNNPKNPVLPDHDRIKITVHVRPQNATIKFSDKNSYVQLNHGDVSFEAYPRLAQAQSGVLKGLRVIPTSNTRFENVVFRNVSGMLYSEKVNLAFDVAQSRFHVQVGVGENGEENNIAGEITAFGNTRAIPTDSNALNPHYDAAKFIQTYSCIEELNGVVEYKNEHLEERIAPGMAALTMLAMSKIATQLSEDSNCGMSSPSFLRSMTFTGEPGKAGEARGVLSDSCKISFNNFKTEPDCFGVAHTINGEVTISEATKLVKGLMFYSEDTFIKVVDNYENELGQNAAGALSKKPEPIIPTSRQPAVIEFTADLSNLKITEECESFGSLDHEAHCSKIINPEPALTFSMSAGVVKATIKPLMGKIIDPADDRYQMCAKAIPVAQTEFTLHHVMASIKKSDNEFQLRAHGTYRAISGVIDTQENELSGAIDIGTVPVAFRQNNVEYLSLKPDYDRQRYEDSFRSCRMNTFIVPQSDDDCSLKELGL